MKRLAEGHRTLAWVARLLRRWQMSRTGGFPDWRPLLEASLPSWQSAIEYSRTGPRVLIATSMGAFWPGSTFESLLAVALTARGANAHILLCDKVLPACQECLVSYCPSESFFARFGPRWDVCRHCFAPAKEMFESLGLPVHSYGNYLSREELSEAEHLATTVPYSDIPGFTLDGMAVGEHSLAGALRFYAKGSLDSESGADLVLRRYFKAGLLTTFAVRRLLRQFKFDVVVFNHGIYVPQGLIGEVARREGVRVVNWATAYRKHCFIFSHGDTYHHTLRDEPTSNWEDMTWGPEQESQIVEYLRSRWRGTRDWIKFHEAPELDRDIIAQQLGVDFSKPCIGMLTNVVWDAQLHYPANAFPNMLAWIHQTIAYFVRRSDLQLIIRVHPAEITGNLPSRQLVVDEIERVHGKLPSNIFIIPPSSRISTYSTMLACNAVIIFGTKTGVELASEGIPVIVAGEAWIRNKGLTTDVTSAKEYFRILDRLPFDGRMDDRTVTRARKYAFHFFFRRMIPLEFMEVKSGSVLYRVKLDSIEQLKPGNSVGLDTICDGILNGQEFVYPEGSQSESVADTKRQR